MGRRFPGIFASKDLEGVPALGTMHFETLLAWAIRSRKYDTGAWNASCMSVRVRNEADSLWRECIYVPS